MLRDAFVSGLASKAILQAIIQDCENKTFNECIEKAKLIEKITSDVQDIKFEPKISESYRINDNSSDRSASAKAVSSDYVCIRCGTKGRHLASKCFALNLTCNKCAKKGHIAKACKTNVIKHNANTVSQEADEQIIDDNYEAVQHSKCNSCTCGDSFLA